MNSGKIKMALKIFNNDHNDRDGNITPREKTDRD